MTDPRPAVFLDRDGTLNVNPPPHQYVTAVEDFRWLPGALDGLVYLARAGFVLAVVSNQRGVARGLVSPELLRGIERIIQHDLGVHGCAIEAFRYCPHDLSAACDCRKPRPGMLTGLAHELSLDLSKSWMVGDAPSDIQAGRAAGCRTVQIAGARIGTGADLVAGSLIEAARLIPAPGAQPPETALASKPATRAS